ncbi:four helix bundle protein [Candidatus Parcubacteria bacterium]|nr:four helix bundle protein [Candidatus Parcubacteria bacterium]
MEYQFEKLTVWQRGMELVEQVYRVTRVFPKDEQFGLTAQLRRAAVSVPLNIAEGKGRYHTKTFIQFLYQARGSLYEVMTLVKVSLKLAYLTEPDATVLLELCGSLAGGINGLINSMK